MRARLIATLAAVVLAAACRRSAPEAAPPDVIPLPHGAQQPAPVPTPTGAVPNPISLENQKTGTADWRVAKNLPLSELAAYAGEDSVAPGEVVDVHVSAAGHEVRWSLYRLGWYGGAGGREIARGGPAVAPAQPVPAADPVTGLVECAWPATFLVTIPPDAVTGVWLVKIRRDDGGETYAPVVVRDDAAVGRAVVEIPTATYQAYNLFGGESLYGDSIGLSAGKAKEVSYDRPYDQGAGAGQLFRTDFDFVQWAESFGYDLAYVTSADLDRDPGFLLLQKMFLAIGHDEYWSRPIREGVQAAVDSGVSAAFLSGNDAYWQIRDEPSRADGRDRRTIVSYKETANTEDPLRGTPLVTTKWRDPKLDEPENELLGIMYTEYQFVDVPWVVSGAGHWVYEGTGVADGDTIPLLVGYETDRVFDNGRTPDDLVVLARSPMITYKSTPDWHHASVYETPAGGFVFAAGTIEWSWGLSAPGVADARVQRITQNLFARAGLEPSLAGDGFGAGIALHVDHTFAGGAVTTIAGEAFDEGRTDGPGAGARFKRPSGIALDPATGDLFVADTGNHEIRRIAPDPSHTVTTVAGTGHSGRGSGPGVSAALSSPTAIAVAADGTLWVADTGNNRVVSIARDGAWTVRTEATGFDVPSGIAVDEQRVFVTDSRRNRVVLLGSTAMTPVVGIDGGLGDDDGPGSSAHLRLPTGLALGDGALFVSDSGNRLVRRIAIVGTSFTVSTVAGAGLPGGFSDGDAGSAGFMLQGGLAVSGGTVFVADAGNDRIRAVHGGHVSTYAGTGDSGGTDGASASARFSLPSGIVVLPDGSLAVADEGDSTIRRIAPPP